MLKTRVLLGLLLMIGGCGADGSQPAQPPDVQPVAPPNVNPPEPPGAMRPREMQSKNPVPPAGAQYTIYCGRVEGQLHVERADRMKKELIASTGMKDWYVVHEPGQSLLYYGYYRTIDAAAQQDRAKIDMMADNMGNRPFKQAVLVELTAPDPVAPPEWNLANASGDCSLEIGVYMGSAQRKQAAVDAVREARARGIEAYYYHGHSKSSVCIGSWPATAYRKVGGSAEEQNRNPNQPLVIAPRTGDLEFDSRMAAIDREGKARVVQTGTEILDPTLLATMKEYPYVAVNGEYQKQIVSGKEIFMASQLVPIPRAEPTVANTFPPQAQPQVAAPAPGNTAAYDPTYRPPLPRTTAAPRQQQPGTGRLRSIGD